MSLTNDQVEDIRKSSGWNQIVSSTIESKFSELKHFLSDPMGLMLLILGFIYLFMGKRTDAVILFLSYIPVTAVDVLLELRAKKALSALKSTLSPTCKVIRNAMIVEIPIREIVPGDSLVFEEGQSLAADGVISECEQLQINESALTGESIPVEKIIGAPFFGGTTIVQGRGTGLVQKIGRETKFGKIATLLEETGAEASPLKKKITVIVKQVMIIALFMAIVLFGVTYYQSQDWTQSLIESLTFAMAAIPEEFLLVFTLYLSMGAYRLSKHGVLIKSLPSVEALGSVDVICTDKTGTLTEGKFQLESLLPFTSNISEDYLWQCALMACEEKAIDAMETAIFLKGEPYKNLLTQWSLKWDYPFEPLGKHMSHVWQHTTTNQTMITMKGSVEGVLEHCQLDEMAKVQVNEQVALWAGKGKRLLGLAARTGTCTGKRDEDEAQLILLGLLIFSDPIRSTAKEAIKTCQESGITIKMLTGDHPLTAHAVADEIGLIHSHEFLFTGDQLSAMNKQDRWSAYQQGSIFSRVLPEQKHEMVQALKSMGKIVAMTGDGINDAPALKTADIGISMGESATDVARSSAQMVLMKNNFQGIIEAVFEGRKIFSNLKKSFCYLISFNIPVVFFAFLAPLLGFGNLLMPIHIVLLELVVHPVSAFSFENLSESKAALKTSLKSTGKQQLMSTGQFFQSALSGILLSLGSFYLYNQTLETSGPIDARSILIATIMMGNIFFVLVESWPVITLRFLLTALILLFFIGVLLYIKPAADLFYLSKLNLSTLLMGLIVAFLASLPTFIIRKLKEV